MNLVHCDPGLSRPKMWVHYTIYHSSCGDLFASFLCIYLNMYLPRINVFLGLYSCFLADWQLLQSVFIICKHKSQCIKGGTYAHYRQYRCPKIQLYIFIVMLWLMTLGLCIVYFTVANFFRSTFSDSSRFLNLYYICIMRQKMQTEIEGAAMV